MDDPVAHKSRRPALRRGRDQMIAGVCSGIARYIGVDVLIVRITFVVLALASGVGLAAYVFAWVVLPQADGSQPAVASLRLDRPRDLERPLAVALIVVGGLLLLRNLGLWFNDAFVWPAALAGGGLAVVWSHTGADERARWTRAASRLVLLRLALGVLLVVAGIGAFLAANDAVAASRQVLVAMLVTVAGIGLLLGPWIVRLLRELGDERRERIRSEERAEMAAHLHDSVLQTLALIQRNSDRPRELVALARRQERELRSWLYGDGRLRREGALAATIEAVADEVEVLHGIDVEVVTVGDLTLDERSDALVDATREAMLNAARHSGAQSIAVYVEVEERKASVFVRDRGSGFDRALVPSDRGGLAGSIEARMARAGGTAVVTSAPGDGTEVALELPIGGRP